MKKEMTFLRILSFCLALAMVMLWLPAGRLTASAAETADMQAQITADRTVASPGTEITFTVTMSGTQPVDIFGMKLIYNEDIFEVVDGAYLHEGAAISTFTPTRGFVSVYEEAVVMDGVVLGIFTLRVKADAPEGDYTVDGAVSGKYGTTNITGTVAAEELTVIVHSLIHFAAVEPDCHSLGNIEYWHCPDCEGFWTDEDCTQLTNSKNVILPAKGSDKLEHIAAVEPNCDTEGNIEYWHCPECEGFWTDEDCTRLTNSKNVILSALGHSWVDYGAVEPGCVEAGNIAYQQCSVCGTARTAGENPNPLGKLEWVLGATGHKYQAEFFWNEAHDGCTATITCSVCKDSATVDCAVTHDRPREEDTQHTALAQYGGETFTDVLNCGNYWVEFLDWDSMLVQGGYYHPGEAVIPPADPSREADVYYSYTFTGWDKPIEACTGNASYQALYRQTRVEYTVEITDFYGNVVSKDTYYYDEQIRFPEIPSQLSDNTYIYTHIGFTDSFCRGDMSVASIYDKEYIDYTVTFQYADGTVISQQTYHYADPVNIPESPVLQGYKFTGWDAEVSEICQGNVVYTARFVPDIIPGDFTGDKQVTNEDVIYLLWYTVFPEDYPISINADFTGDRVVDNQDVIHILWHTVFPEDYPLS